MANKQHQSIFDKLCDTKLYTGAHKHRFDENGNGRGLSGRDRVSKGHGFIAGNSGNVADLSQITRTHLHTSGAGYARPPSPGVLRPLSRGSTTGTTAASGAAGGALLYQRMPSIETNKLQVAPLSPTSPLSPTGPATPSPRPASAGRSALRSSYSGAPSPGASGPGAGLAAFGNVSGAGSSLPAAVRRSSDAGQQQRPPSSRGSGIGSGGGSIFDRLNDPSSYTGMHRQRFSSNGRGRGAEGRTMPNAYVSAMDNVRR